MIDPEQYWLDVPAFARVCLGFEPDARQALVLNPTIRRGLLNCTRQWGKSTVTAIKAVHRAYFHPESLVVVVSPSGRQSGEFVWKAKRLVRRLGMRPRGDGENEISILFPNGSRIVGLPGREDTSRGFSSVSLMLIDEAARVKDELYHSLTPMLSMGAGAGGAGGQLWLMSTPHGKRGFFWEAWEKQVGRWYRVSVPATDCPRISKAFLEEQRASMGERRFRQEYLCEFVQTEDAVFSEEDIQAAFRDDVPGLWE